MLFESVQLKAESCDIDACKWQYEKRFQNVHKLWMVRVTTAPIHAERHIDRYGTWACCQAESHHHLSTSPSGYSARIAMFANPVSASFTDDCEQVPLESEEIKRF
jgi:hypothetical protein